MSTATRASQQIAPAVAIDATILPAKVLQLQQDDQGVWTCRFDAPSEGLYQLSVIVDARDYDWERTYVHLHQYHNKGQRTGPWDFELGTNLPLIPAYWVDLNGRRLGMWFFQRVSLDDIAHQRFRGNVAIHVNSAGPQELKIESCAAQADRSPRWLSCRLEVDPDDTLEPVAAIAALKPAVGNVPVAQWTQDRYWDEQQRKLATTHACYQQPLKAAFEWAMQHEDSADHRSKPVLDIPILVAGMRLGWLDQARTLERIVALMDEAIHRPYWGKSEPGAYGHNGDMGASLLMRSLAWALHILRPEELGPQRRQQLLDKLAWQGDRFLEQMLLNRDYWGGSLRQDHGWRSTWLFGTSALLLNGVLPQANTWLRYILPRMRRGLAAMSRDGMIPPSSHGSLYLYVDEASEFRRTLLSLGGEDIYDQGAFRGIVDFVCQVLKPGTDQMLLGNSYRLTGGSPFFADLARTDGNQKAAWLLEQQLTRPQPRNNAATANLIHKPVGHHHSLFWSYFVYDPSVTPKAPDQPRRQLAWFKDDARVQYQDRVHDMTLYLRCGPHNGYHAYFNAPGPCDRTEGEPHAGHFVLYLKDKQILTTPVSGYRLKTFVGSVMLIDDQGQIGDETYPMGIPSWEHPGHYIEFARLDEQTGHGCVRMQLKPAYDKALNLACYTRDLIFTPERLLICRDYVVLDKPRKLSWLFQADREVGITMISPLKARFGSDPALTIEPAPGHSPLNAGIHETDVVHSYSSTFHTFDHLRYDTPQAVGGMAIDYLLRW